MWHSSKVYWSLPYVFVVNCRRCIKKKRNHANFFLEKFYVIMKLPPVGAPTALWTRFWGRKRTTLRHFTNILRIVDISASRIHWKGSVAKVGTLFFFFTSPTKDIKAALVTIITMEPFRECSLSLCTPLLISISLTKRWRRALSPPCSPIRALTWGS